MRCDCDAKINSGLLAFLIKMVVRIQPAAAVDSMVTQWGIGCRSDTLVLNAYGCALCFDVLSSTNTFLVDAVQRSLMPMILMFTMQLAGLSKPGPLSRDTFDQ